jgi:hypothetical protein
MPAEAWAALTGLAILATTILQTWYQQYKARLAKDELAVKTERIASQVAATVTDVATTVKIENNVIASALEERVAAIESWQMEHKRHCAEHHQEVMAMLAKMNGDVP